VGLGWCLAGLVWDRLVSVRVGWDLVGVCLGWLGLGWCLAGLVSVTLVSVRVGLG